LGTHGFALIIPEEINFFRHHEVKRTLLQWMSVYESENRTYQR
jgi:hypothetical protein